MIAAIYVRKSTEQTGVADDQKSVARQVEHARAYAQRKGWTVADEHVYMDDGISGAEFANRPGFIRLMNALKPRPAFQVLVMSEESRLGREAIETAYALKQIVTAGVRVFFYMEDRERTLNSPMEKAMLAIQAMSDELEREKARQRVYDAMSRKARASHVTGGQCFGYRNVDVTAPGSDGRMHRQYVRREIQPDEAAIVRRIFHLCAAGAGLKGITKTLNAEGVAAPRAQRGRPHAWAPSSVRAILYRECYRGVIVWNKSRKRDTWGQKRQAGRPESEWMRVPAAELRIVSDALWTAAHDRLGERRILYRTAERVQAAQTLDLRAGRRSYLLSGFASCACCGAAMQGVSRKSTTGRLFRYVCGAYVNRGESVCANRRMAAMDVADVAIRELLAREVLKPAVLERALDQAIGILRDDGSQQQRVRRRRELVGRIDALDRELGNLANLAARGGNVPAILDAVQQRDAERRRLAAELEAYAPDASRVDPIDPRSLRSELRAYTAEWQQLTRSNGAETRALLGTVLRSRIVFQPATKRGAAMYELTVPIQFDRVLTAAVPSLARVGMASPNGLATLPTEFALLIPAA